MEKKNTATIRDVAVETGLSLGTISRYLNGFQLKAQNMEKIRQAIEKLGYEENLIAKGLKNNKTLSVGVLVNSLSDPLVAGMLSKLEERLEEHNYSLILCDFQNDEEKLYQKLNFLRLRNVDGIIAFHLENKPKLIEKVQETTAAVVLVDSKLKKFQGSSVEIDYYKAAYELVDRLNEQGHDKIAFIYSKKAAPVEKERLRGYRDSMRDKGLYRENLLVQTADGYAATQSLLQKGLATVLYLPTYALSLAALWAISDLKLSVPEDISLVGVGLSEIDRLSKPRLNSQEMPVDDMAEQVARLLLANMRERDSAIEKVALSSQLLWNDSVKALSSKDKK